MNYLLSNQRFVSYLLHSAFFTIVVAVFSCNVEDISTSSTSLLFSKNLTFEINSESSTLTYLKISSGGEVVVVDAPKASTLEWDFSTSGASVAIITNKVSGSKAGVQVLKKSFEEVVEAPADGYKQELADFSEWANYNPSSRLTTIIAGRTLVFRTASGKYAKMQITSLKTGPLNTATQRPSTYKIAANIVYQDAQGVRTLKN